MVTYNANSIRKAKEVCDEAPFDGNQAALSRNERRDEDGRSRMEDRGWRKAMIYTSSSIVDLILYSRSSILYPRCSILDLLFSTFYPRSSILALSFIHVLAPLSDRSSWPGAPGHNRPEGPQQSTKEICRQKSQGR